MKPSLYLELKFLKPSLYLGFYKFRSRPYPCHCIAVALAFFPRVIKLEQCTSRSPSNSQILWLTSISGIGSYRSPCFSSGLSTFIRFRTARIMPLKYKSDHVTPQLRILKKFIIPLYNKLKPSVTRIKHHKIWPSPPLWWLSLKTS